jgi:hypothetical protein
MGVVESGGLIPRSSATTGLTVTCPRFVLFPRAVADKVYYEHRVGIICSVDIVRILMAARGLLMWVLPGQLWAISGIGTCWGRMAMQGLRIRGLRLGM